VITLLFIIVGLILVYLSPLDYQQGLTVKIMYIHVPSAWLALLIYAVMTIYSILGLTFKIPFSFIINKAIAPIGAVFTLLCLISGSMWGKPMWGTWWVWDARLTSVAILFAIYLVIIFLNQTFENREVKEKTVAIFILIGSIGSIIVLLFSIPVIIFSVGINKVDSNFNSLINLLFGIALIFLGISPWSSAACIKLALKNK
jgi:heme exporter protein C